MENKVLVIIDPQLDFTNGSMAVEGASLQMHNLTEYLKENLEEYRMIVITLDWHPIDHCSFAKQGGPWPPHCVAFTKGALPYPELYSEVLERKLAGTEVEIILKGKDKDIEEYGAFNTYKDPYIWQNLLNAKEIDVVGIMSEYCVLESVMGMVDHYPELHKKINLKLPYIATMDAHEKLLEYANCEGIKYEN